MSNTFDKKLLNGEVTLKLLQGLKTKIDSSDVQATRVKGVLDIANIPPSALPTLKVVQNDTERFKLTSRDVKRGDTVKVIETNKLYLVTDTSRLSSPDGYTEYAQTVNWDTIQGRPETFEPSEHTQATSTINSLQGYVKGEETSALSPSDTLNAALSKLESSLGLKLNRNIPELKGTEKDIVNSINKNVGQFIKGQIDNMDLVTETGWYLCNSNCTGAPATFEGIVMSFNGGEGTSVKVWYSVTQESMYIKQTFPGVVKQEWTKVLTKADVDEAKGAIEQAISEKQNKTDETLLTRDKNVTGAINELHTEKQSKNDGGLQTESKDVVGAINELKEGKANSVHDHKNLYNTKEEITQLLATKENNIVKNTAFNKNFGTTSGTVLEGDRYEELLTTFETGQSRLEGVVQKKLDQAGGTVTGDLTVDGTLITANNKGVQCKDNIGTPKTVIQIDTNNNIKVGDSTSKIILDSSDVELKSGNSLWTSGNFTPSEKQNVNDPTLQTSTKTIVGAINEVLTSTKEFASNLGTKAPLVHTHDDRYTPTATLDVRLSEIEENVLTKEPIIADKKTAFNKDFGTTVGTVLEGSNLAVLEGKINERQSKTDISLTTSDKTIVGAINEIKANTLGSTGGKVDGAINSVEHNGAGNYNIIESDGRTVHGTLYGRATASDGIGEVGLYNKKSQKGIRLKDDGNTLIDSKSLTTVSKEMTGAINELNDKKFDKTGGTLTGVGEILKIKNNDTRGSAYISFFNDGIKKGWIGRGSSGIDSIAMHNQYSGKGLTLKHDGGTHIDAMNLNTKSKEVIGAINELNVGKMNIDGSTKMKGSISFDYGTPQAPNIKFLDSSGSIHGSLNSRGGGVDEDVYLENNTSGNGIYFKDNGEVRLSAKKSMWIGAPNLQTNSKEIIGAINELKDKGASIQTSFKIQIAQSPNQTISVKLTPPISDMTLTSSTTVEYLYPSFEVSVIASSGFIAGKPNVSVGILNRDISISATSPEKVPITEWFESSDPTGRDTIGQGKQGVRYTGTQPISDYNDHDMLGFESTACTALAGSVLRRCTNLRYVNLQKVTKITADFMQDVHSCEILLAPEVQSVDTLNFLRQSTSITKLHLPKLQVVENSAFLMRATVIGRLDLPQLRTAANTFLYDCSVPKIFMPLVTAMGDDLSQGSVDTVDIFAPNLDYTNSSITSKLGKNCRSTLKFVVVYNCPYESQNRSRKIYIHPDKFSGYSGRDKNTVVKSWTEIPEDKLIEYGNPMDYYPAPPKTIQILSLDEELDVVRADLVKTQTDIDTCEKLGLPPNEKQLEKKNVLLKSHKNICEELAYKENHFKNA